MSYLGGWERRALISLRETIHDRSRNVIAKFIFLLTKIQRVRLACAIVEGVVNFVVLHHDTYVSIRSLNFIESTRRAAYRIAERILKLLRISEVHVPIGIIVGGLALV